MPGLVQTLVGVTRPLDARLSLRDRYGSVFRTNDAIGGQLFPSRGGEAVVGRLS